MGNDDMGYRVNRTFYSASKFVMAVNEFSTKEAYHASVEGGIPARRIYSRNEKQSLYNTYSSYFA